MARVVPPSVAGVGEVVNRKVEVQVKPSFRRKRTALFGFVSEATVRKVCRNSKNCR